MGRRSRCITPSVLLALLAAAAAVAAADDTTGANSSTAERPLPLWPAAFSAASYHMTPFPQALQGGGDASPLIVHAPSSLLEGRWDYHPAARRQRLAYSVPVAAAEGSSDALLSLLSPTTERERHETPTVVTLVELWRGHDELYIFSPEFPRACALLDWPYSPLPVDWPQQLAGRLAFQGSAFDAQGPALLWADIWATEATAAAPVPTIAHFLASSSPSPTNNTTEDKTDNDDQPAKSVPLRLMGPAFPGATAAARAVSFTGFVAGTTPEEALFALPAACRGLTTLAVDAQAERRSAALLRLAGVDPDNTGDVSRLHSTFLSAQTVLGAAVAAETEAEA